MKSKYFPLIVGFIVVFGGAVYLGNSDSRDGLQQGLSIAVGLLPRFIVAVVIALAAGHVISLLSGRKRSEKAFANGSLIVFLLITALLLFKHGWVQDQIDQRQQQFNHWLHGTQPPGPKTHPRQQPPHATPPPTRPPKPHPNLADWASQVNRQLPHRLDKYTQLSRVSYVVKSNTVFIRYDVDGFDSLGVDEDEFVNRMRGNNLREYCQGNFLRDPRTANARVNIQYHYHYGGTIGAPIRLAPNSCQ